jgi:hypothetical protein
MEGKRFSCDIRTGKVTIETYEYNLPPVVIPKGIDLVKLRNALINKGVLTASDLDA